MWTCCAPDRGFHIELLADPSMSRQAAASLHHSLHAATDRLDQVKSLTGLIRWVRPQGTRHAALVGENFLGWPDPFRVAPDPTA